MKIKDSTKQKARDRFNAKTSGLEMLTDFAGWNKDIEIRCTTCGFVFTRKYQAVKTQSGITCPQCRKNATKAKTEERTRIERATRKAQFDKDEEERHKQVVADRCEGFVYVGNYTGSNGVADIQCTTCGTVITRSWVAIRHSPHPKLNCPVCESIKAEQKKQERQVLREERKRRKKAEAFKRIKPYKGTQVIIKACEECGTLFTTTRELKIYCSTICQHRVANRMSKDKRLSRIGRRLVDKDISLQRLYEKENGVCYLCGRSCNWNYYTFKDGTFIAGNDYPSVDHITPLSNGGSHSWDNVRLAHRLCNSRKRNLPLLSIEL